MISEVVESDQAELERSAYGLTSVGGVELFEDAAKVGFNRWCRNAEILRQSLSGVALRHAP